MVTGSPLSAPRETAIVTGLVAAAAGLAWIAAGWLSTGDLALIFLLGVALAGGTLGLRAALLCSALSFLAYNFLFTEPRYTLLVANREDLASLVAFLLVSIIVGQLAARLRERAAEAQHNAERVSRLFEFSRRITTAVDERDLLDAAARGIGDILAVRCVVLTAAPDGSLAVPAGAARGDGIDRDELEAAYLALEKGIPCGLGTPHMGAAGWRFDQVPGAERALGVIATAGRTAKWQLGQEEERLLFALRMQLASAWERFRLQQSAANARLDESAAKLRAALLASVSHDLRTPLVSVIGSLSALKDIDAHLTAADRAALTQTALEEAERLNRFVQNLLDMTRLSYGALKPRLASVSVREAVEESIRRLGSALAAHPVDLRIDAGLPPAWADRTLLEQVLINLLDNAAKYSPAAEPLTVEAHADGDEIIVAVSDRGTGILADEADKVFELFYRARQRDSAATGQGLGLPICRGFVDAMGGRIRTLRGQDGRGTRMQVTLPVANKATMTAGDAR